MQVFHYLADQLQNIPIFDCVEEDNLGNDGGAIYNDFDNDPISMLEDESEASFSFSQCSSDVFVEEPEEAPKEAVTSIIMSVEHAGPSISLERSFNIESSEYLNHVYKLAILDEDAWAFLKVTPQMLKAYQMRYDND